MKISKLIIVALSLVLIIGCSSSDNNNTIIDEAALNPAESILPSDEFIADIQTRDYFQAINNGYELTASTMRSNSQVYDYAVIRPTSWKITETSNISYVAEDGENFRSNGLTLFDSKNSAFTNYTTCEDFVRLSVETLGDNTITSLHLAPKEIQGKVWDQVIYFYQIPGLDLEFDLVRHRTMLQDRRRPIPILNIYPWN
jgi:hypothetical protein